MTTSVYLPSANACFLNHQSTLIGLTIGLEKIYIFSKYHGFSSLPLHYWYPPEVIKDPRGNVQELLVQREHNKGWLFLQKSTCTTQLPSTALTKQAPVNRTLQASGTPISLGGPRDQHWQTVVYSLRYSWNRLWRGWGAQGTTILHLEPVPPIFRKM